MITTADPHLAAAPLRAGACEPRSYRHALQQSGDVLPSLGVAAILVLAKVLELYATNAI